MASQYRYANIFYSTWALLVAGLLFALPMMHMRIKDYTDYHDENSPDDPQDLED
jgi:hypothetical protein